MKKTNVKVSFMTTALIMLVLSCSETETRTNNVEYIPFQETSDGQWGMISMDGKTLFKEEFRKEPTIVRDGRFFVRAEDDFWEIYVSSAKPKKIGGEYAHVSSFHNGKALVAERGNCVSLINVEGKTIKKLDKIEGKEVSGVRPFKDGYAVFMTNDSLYGAIDEDGLCTVKPEYCYLSDCGDGKFLGINKKYKKELFKSKKNIKHSVVNTSGKLLFDYFSDKYENTRERYVDGKLAVSVKKNGAEIWGMIDDKGEYIVQPSSSLKKIGTIHDDMFVYNNGEGWGLMNTKGEILIRAKYEFLYYDEDNRLLARDSHNEYRYIDMEDNKIGDDTYVVSTLFSMFDGQHALAKQNDMSYSIIDKDCKQVEGLPDIVNIGTCEGEGYIESDYVDISKLVNEFDITPNSIFDISLNDSNSKPKNLIKRDSYYSLAVRDNNDVASWYLDQDYISFEEVFDGVFCCIRIGYPEKLSTRTYSLSWKSYWFWGGYYENVPTGYAWNDIHPYCFQLGIYNNGKMYGKLRMVFDAFLEKFKTIGSVVKQSDFAAYIDIVGGRKAVIFMDDDTGSGKTEQVRIIWGDIDTSSIDEQINSRGVVSEEFDSTSISYEYINNSFPANSKTDY